jgi:hypothetical protein
MTERPFQENTMIPSKAENPNGLHHRYNVTKADGSPRDPNAAYFVLRLDSGGSDPAHIKACRAAAREYARCAPGHLRQMADELENYVENQDRRDYNRSGIPGPLAPPLPPGPPPVA